MKQVWGKCRKAFGMGALGAALLAGCASDKGAGEKRSVEGSGGGASVSVSVFGKTRDGREVKQYRLDGAGGIRMDVIDYGARLVRLFLPDRDNKLADVTLGFNDVASYETVEPYFGATIGRVANRIAGGAFTLDGKTYRLPMNDRPGGRPCSLHGGASGFNDRVWDSEPLRRGGDVGVKFTLTSPDGDQGYPGTVKASVTYWLTAENVWRLEYEAVTDKPTPINLTNHAYFNFNGEADGTILGHRLSLSARGLLPVDEGLIPTGALERIAASSPFDFSLPREIGAGIDLPYPQLKRAHGYDHTFVLKTRKGRLDYAGMLYDPRSGRCVGIWTDQPGLQVYSGNFLTDKIVGKCGRPLRFRGGLALETQHFPDSPNRPEFPSVILRPGEVYRTVTEYRFCTFFRDF